MDREKPAAATQDECKFEPPRLTRLGRVEDLTRATNPGVNNDFFLTSF
jgi:hypothetical protein